MRVVKPIHTIAVDLTPLLPGGENGGAKIFVLELLHQLTSMLPEVHFIFLTQAMAHDGLATMDRANIERQQVVSAVVAQGVRPRLQRLARELLPYLPPPLRHLVSRGGYALNAALKRGGSRGLLRDRGVDLLLCPFTAPTYHEPGIPTVCILYDLQYQAYPMFFAPEDLANREQTFWDACRRATLIVAISDYTRDMAIRYGRLDPGRIRTIPLRMAQRLVTQGQALDPRDILARLGLTSGQYLLYPANFWKHKNHEMLLTAFGMARHAGLPPDIRLVCTGTPGARQDYLVQAVHRMDLEGCVRFPGYLSDPAFAVLLANSCGLVFPSLYEGFGLPIIEAMAAGVPVACSNLTALQEVAGKAAILFDPRVPTQIVNALFTLVGDDPLRTRLIQAGRQRAIEFADSKQMASEYWALLKSILRQPA
ncbi:mannosyl-N-acetyl-alpha-D-glucosaminyl-diphospho-ditrans,octacis-undecaprenol 3-alpha-mannosyltransferase / alpha-1,3-rhamnosyltransferase [Gammaproteobacteria bacterium]